MEHALSVEARGICSLSRWVAVEFKKHQLRVGSPFVGTDAKSNIGAIFRLDLGDPNIYYQDHMNIASDLKDAIAGVTDGVDVKVVLPIHVCPDPSDCPDGAASRTWTSAAVDTTCYKSGNACPEAHSVCDPSYCSIERWNEIILELQNAGAKVLGLICAFPRPHVSLQVVGLLAPPQHFDCRPSCSDLQKAKLSLYLRTHPPALSSVQSLSSSYHALKTTPKCPSARNRHLRPLRGGPSPGDTPQLRILPRGPPTGGPPWRLLSRSPSPGISPQEIFPRAWVLIRRLLTKFYVDVEVINKCSLGNVLRPGLVAT